MNKLLLILHLTVLGGLTACGQVKSKIIVVDEENNPIDKAEVKFTYVNYKSDKVIKVITNKRGVVENAGTAELRVNLVVSKTGYYTTGYRNSDGKFLSKSKNHDLKVTLKKIENPIPLYARSLKIIAPVLDQRIGFDLEVGDWVRPHGKGAKIDIYFYINYQEKSPKNYDYSLVASFPNDLDGLQEFSSERVSDLWSIHKAPEGGYNTKKWEQSVIRRPETGRKGNRDQLRNYWLRIRSKVDSEGNLESANYVKIYGDFPQIKYYFNPTTNDRNLEFATEKNLFSNLIHKEKVTQP